MSPQPDSVLDQTRPNFIDAGVRQSPTSWLKNGTVCKRIICLNKHVQLICPGKRSRLWDYERQLRALFKQQTLRKCTSKPREGSNLLMKSTSGSGCPILLNLSCSNLCVFVCTQHISHANKRFSLQFTAKSTLVDNRQKDNEMCDG